MGKRGANTFTDYTTNYGNDKAQNIVLLEF